MGSILNDLKVDRYNNDYTDLIMCYSDMFLKEMTLKEVVITDGEALMYKGNFSKVCTKALEMSLKYLPLLLKINGFKSVVEYDGRTHIKSFDPNILENYLKHERKK